jgi:hypothetical protein
MSAVAASDSGSQKAPGDQSRGGGRKYLQRDYILALCAPILLVLVAISQRTLARQAGLSPWKGGGFGMFATVDSPSARFLRVYLVHGGEGLPVFLPDKLSPLAREVRTLPSRSRLEQLARSVAEGIWVRYNLSPAVTQYQSLLAQHLGRHPPLHGSPRPISKGGTGATRSRPVDVLSGRSDLLRMAEHREFVPPEEALRFEHVRVELWRYTYDATSHRLVAKREMGFIQDRGRLW